MKTNHKIAFSIDTDDWYHAHGISGADFSLYKDSKTFLDNWKERYDYITEAGLNLLDELDRLGLTITFFVIADEVKRYPELMERLKSSNHEIACHSLYHTAPFSAKTNELTQSHEQWKRELGEAMEILTGFFNSEIIGYRAPGAFFADWMIPILLEAGIKYDSSVVANSLYKKNSIDHTGYDTTPFYYKGIVELPWSNYKIGPWHLPVGGAFFFRLFGKTYFKTALKNNLKKGDTQFYMHFLDLVDEDFPLGNNKSRPMYWVNKGSKTARNLTSLLEHFQDNIGTCRQVYENFINGQDK